MNWTGGRLRRHSKANANAQVKAQKDYFARARLRQNTNLSAPTPLQLSIAAAVSEQQEQPHHSLHLPDQNPAIHAGRSQNGRRSSKVFERAAQKIPATDPASTLHRRAKVQSSHGTTPPRVNTLEHVKRSLLKQSDWLGLAGTRPPKPDQKPAAILEQVGRRRRVTRGDRHRQKYGAGQRKIEHIFIKPFAEVDDATALWPTPSTNLSIRIGTNIHLSQTTKPERPSVQPASAIPGSSSTEPMLLDMVEAQRLPAMQKPGEYYLAEPKDAVLLNGQDIPDEGDLIPLEKLRDFASFDEVKRYSSSARHIATSSSRSVSNELLRGDTGPQTRPIQHTSGSFVHGKSVDDPGLFSSDGDNHRLVNIGSEPPVFTTHREDAMMQDIDANAAMVDTNSAGQEARELRFLNLASVVSQKSPSAFENSNHSGPSLAIAAIDAKSNFVFRDAPHGKSPSKAYPRPRPPYTIERQVQLEEARNQQSNHLALPVNSRSNVAIESNTQDYRRHRRHEENPANKTRGPPTRYFTPEAREGSNQNDQNQISRALSSSGGNGHRRQGDENEAWMRDVFSTDFEMFQERFSFAKAPTRRTIHPTPPRKMNFGEQHTELANKPASPDWRKQSSQHSSELSLPKTIKTGVNTVLNVPNELDHDRLRNIFIPSETDFLTQMSPMTGYLDDRIVNLSMHNNAANTVHEFLDPGHMAGKRTASDAFGDNSYDQCDTNSYCKGKVAQLGSPAPHRVPLHTLYQVPVRAHPVDKSHAIHGDPDHVSGPVWQPAKGPSMVNNKRTDRPLQSREQFKRPSGRYNQHARFQLDHTPAKNFAGQLRNSTQVEVPWQTITSHFNPQVYSPTQSSGHRVPLTSGLATNNTDVISYGHQPLTKLAMNRNPTPSARFGTSTSSQSADLAPISSSSGIPVRNPTRPVDNFHTNHAQRFGFKRPQRPTAQYAQHSRATPQFRTPPSIPLLLH